MTHLISIDHRGMVSVDGEPIGAHVTSHEEATLRAILTHNAVATKDALLTAVYGGRDEPEMKILDVYVAKLRKKLGVHRNAIETVWGRGYCRGPDYAIAEPPPDVVAVMVNAKLIEDVVYCDDARRSASQIIEALLTAEHNRFWAKVA